jgi:sulfatase modifying factor 1
MLCNCIWKLLMASIVIAGCAVTKKKHAIRPEKAISVELTNAHILMQWIPSGTFTMGSSLTEAGRKTDEAPQTQVTVSNGFWMQQTECTIAQWKAVMGETLRQHVINMLNDETVYDFGTQQKKLREFMNFNRDDPGRIMANENDSLPMYFVSWDDAMAFCRKLTEQQRATKLLPEGYEYTLPTEAQWEYACRAGSSSATFAGSLIMEGRAAPVLDTIAWYSGNNAVNYRGKKLGSSGAGPRNAGEKKSNVWGLQDMTGNLWEWCRDWYGAYPGGSIIDPSGPAMGSARVNRGGSWGSGANDARSANRARNPQPEKSAYRGFRIALVRV